MFRYFYVFICCQYRAFFGILQVDMGWEVSEWEKFGFLKKML